MADPWDVPPFPVEGDDIDDTTYAAVGRVLSRWEELEVCLTHLHAAFLGRPHDPEAHRAYGQGTIFRTRFDTLKQAAERFFIFKPNQEREAKFDELADKALRFSDRRNEVAHGVVRPIHWYKSAEKGDRTSVQFILVPPHYNVRKFGLDYRPSFAYTSATLLPLERHLFEFTGGLIQYRIDVLRSQNLQPPVLHEP